MQGKPLSTFKFSDGTCIPQASVRPQPPVHLDSPASAVMTDLTVVRAATVGPTDSLAQAETAMVHQGVRMLFVVSQMPCVDGIVTLADLHGDKPMKVLRKRGGPRDELTVSDVMSALADLDVLDLGSLARATVADVVSTLHRLGRPHLLVVEAATASAMGRIRGVVSHSQVERQLGVALPMVEIASTFSEIEQALV
jgi:CBS-domain-containing membrane protein